MKLKDPESGKVVEFVGTKLTYTATNGYGARIQGHALCSISDGSKWARDYLAEEAAISKLAADKIWTAVECMKAGGTEEKCAGNSDTLKRAALMGVTAAPNDLEKEAARELGFSS